MSEMITVAEAAKLLGMATSTVYTWIRRGEFEGARRIEGKWMVPRASVTQRQLTKPARNERNVERELRIVEAYQRLGTKAAVAREFHISPTRVGHLLARHGIVPPQRVRAEEPRRQPLAPPEPRPAWTAESRAWFRIHFYLRGIRLEDDDFCPPSCQRWWKCLDDGDRCDYDDGNYA